MPNVSAVYPSQVINYGADVINFTTTVLAEHVNYLRAEVTAVETTLGTYVTTSSGWIGSFTRPSISSTWNTLKDRINNIEYGLSTVYDAKVPTGGSSGQILQKSSSTDYDFTWVTFTGLPSQSSNSGKYLTTDGSSASWASISQVPSQTSQSGKYLTTDGSTSSWATISQVPSQTGNSGKYLTTDGSTASWGTVTTGGANEFVLMMMGS